MSYDALKPFMAMVDALMDAGARPECIDVTLTRRDFDDVLAAGWAIRGPFDPARHRIVIVTDRQPVAWVAAAGSRAADAQPTARQFIVPNVTECTMNVGGIQLTFRLEDPPASLPARPSSGP